MIWNDRNVQLPTEIKLMRSTVIVIFLYVRSCDFDVDCIIQIKNIYIKTWKRDATVNNYTSSTKLILPMHKKVPDQIDASADVYDNLLTMVKN